MIVWKNERERERGGVNEFMSKYCVYIEGMYKCVHWTDDICTAFVIDNSAWVSEYMIFI